MRSSWTRFNVDLGYPTSGDEIRQNISNLLYLSQAPEEQVKRLLHYGESAPLNGFSPVKFKGGLTGFSLIGFGEEAEDLIRALAPTITTALSVKEGRRVIISESKGECSARHIPYRKLYSVRKVVHQRKRSHIDALEKDTQGFLERLLSRSLKTQADFLGLDLPELDLRLESFDPGTAVSLGHGRAAFGFIKNVVFSLPVSLRGWWALGFLTSNGYGLMDSNIPVLTRQRGQ